MIIMTSGPGRIEKDCGSCKFLRVHRDAITYEITKIDECPWPKIVLLADCMTFRCLNHQFGAPALAAEYESAKKKNCKCITKCEKCNCI